MGQAARRKALGITQPQTSRPVDRFRHLMKLISHYSTSKIDRFIEIRKL